MTYRVFGVLAAACLLVPVSARAQPARELYTRALAQERVVRNDSARPTLVQIRRVVASYESLVRRHPASGYADNALWQGANLARLAFERFGQDADRRTSARLLAQLARSYPTSKLAVEAAALLSAQPAAGATGDARQPAGPAPVAALLDAPAAVAPAPLPPAAAPAVRRSRIEPGSGDLSTLRDVKRTVLPDGVRITVELDAEVAYHQEEIVNPRRLFFDLKNVKATPRLQDTALRFDDDIVREIRLGRHPQNTTRLAIDLDGVGTYTVYPMYGPYRLVIDVRRVAAAAAELPAPARAAPAPPTLDARSGVSAPAATDVKRAVFAAKPPAPAIERAEPKPPLPSKPAPASLTPSAPAANSNGKFSLSRQLGLGVSRIVIDAGHGGHDPGAHGNGINEAELTLDVALRLQRLLGDQGVDVVMTRDTDVFIPLEQRTAIANREGADLFLSIHANASRNSQARGVETYFLNFATNPEAEAVAARENAASGQPMHSLPDLVKTITLNNKINESRELAETVQKSMVKRLGTKNRTLRDLGVKQAPFVVLIGAGMPSVLAEISFVTNRQDGLLLKNESYRQQIAQALMDAVVHYQQSLKRISGIAAKKATNP